MRLTVAALAALAVACGGDPAGGDRVSIPISLAADPATCGVALPLLRTGCESNVGVWLLDGATDEILAKDCVPFEAGASDLSRLPAVLSSEVDLGTIDAPRFRLELAVYSPADPACTRFVPGDVDAPLLAGRSEVVVTEEADRVALTLTCPFSGDPQEASCLGFCASDGNACLSSNEALEDACDSGWDACVDGCTSTECTDACDEEEEVCRQGLEDCDAGYAACRADCVAC